MEQDYRLFIGDLFSSVTEKKLQKKFASFGPISNIEVKQRKDEEGHIINTFAYLNIQVPPADLQNCIAELSSKPWHGHTMKIQQAKESFLSRLQKERERREAGGPHHNSHSYDDYQRGSNMRTDQYSFEQQQGAHKRKFKHEDDEVGHVNYVPMEEYQRDTNSADSYPAGEIPESNKSAFSEAIVDEDVEEKIYYGGSFTASGDKSTIKERTKKGDKLQTDDNKLEDLKYYKVSKSIQLSEKSQESSGFSLLETYGKIGKEEDDDEESDDQSEEHKVAPRINWRALKRKMKESSSASKTLQPDKKTKVTSHSESFFFYPDDTRLQDGLQFFNRGENKEKAAREWYDRKNGLIRTFKSFVTQAESKKWWIKQN